MMRLEKKTSLDLAQGLDIVCITMPICVVCQANKLAVGYSCAIPEVDTLYSPSLLAFQNILSYFAWVGNVWEL
jgi:hypothetical protein